METFMDTLTVESVEGYGTTVKMTKEVKSLSDEER